jgi:hypothetical protein
MAKTVLKIELTGNVTSQLISGVKRMGSRKWAGRALANASLISKDIGNMLVGIFNNTPVAMALKGHGSEDLPAHLGLDDTTANGLVDGMAHLIRSSVRIISRENKNIMSLRIQAVERDWSEYLSLPGAQYVSSPSNITIPVAKWLLIDPNIDIGQAAYDIVFQGEDDKFEARIQKTSRSGRAIMVSLETLGGTGGYVLPAIISGQAGHNFIEYALGQSDVAMKAAALLMKRVI